MADLHLVVYLGSAANYGGSCCSTIYRGVGAYFYIVFYDHSAYLRYFPMGLPVKYIAESVGTDNCAGVDNDP